MISSVPTPVLSVAGDLGHCAQKWKMWVKLQTDEDVKLRHSFSRLCLLIFGLKHEGRW